MTTAVIVLMIITSMGIFGFLSKAHSDQSLVSGDVMAKISVYDEKIKTAKDNIDANRKALKQMDEAVDQVMGRSNDEKGADKAVAIRRGQQKERSRLQSEIAAEQKIIAQINEERAPIAAEVRKVEAEVGPLKYIAAFVYGATDESILEKAVTWVIITIIVVFDPLAVIMLLAAQMTFGWKKEEEAAAAPVYVADVTMPDYEPDDGPLTEEQVEQIKEDAQPFLPTGEVVSTSTLFVDAGEHPQDTFEHEIEQEEVIVDQAPTVTLPDTLAPAEIAEPVKVESELDKWNKMIEQAEAELEKEKKQLIEAEAEKYQPIPEVERPGDYLPEEESKKKTYMTKDQTGTIQLKSRE